MPNCNRLLVAEPQKCDKAGCPALLNPFRRWSKAICLESGRCLHVISAVGGMKARGYPSESSLIPISAVDTFRLTYTPIFRRLALRAFELAGRLP